MARTHVLRLAVLRLAVLRLAVGAAAAAPLAACGFTPLYATPGMTPALSSVDVVLPGTSRTGYLLRQELDKTLARDHSEPALYRLSLKLTEYRAPRGVRVNNIANRYEIGVQVAYTLSDAATGKVLNIGAATSEVSYDSADPPYAGVAANQDGEQRAAEQTAIRIRLALSRYFEHQAVR